MWPFSNKVVPTIPLPPPPPRAPKVYPDCEFDIEGVQVIAIERDVCQDLTVIGYRNPEGELGEWELSVSPAAHDALVKRFRVKLGLLSSTNSTPSNP